MVTGLIILLVGAGVIPCFYGKTIPISPSLINVSRQIGGEEQRKLIDDFASASLFFTQNQGQFPAEVIFQTHVAGATVYFCKNKIVTVFTREPGSAESLDLKDNSNPVLNRMMMHEHQQSEMISTVAEFVDANPDVVITGEHRLLHCNNYFIGNNPLKWYTDVPNYIRVTYYDVYPGVDLTYYGLKDGGLKYDFIVHPGANVSVIQIRYTGVDGLSIGQNGALSVETSFGVISENIPLVYQKVDGVTHKVRGRYDVISEAGVFGFVIDEYNPAIPLIIDPELEYSTYLGGSQKEQGWGITVDNSGDAYVTGRTYSIDFPLENQYDGTYNGNGDIFVSKFSPSGNMLVYSTYLGGSDDESTWWGDDGGIAVDDSGNVYVVGTTFSVDFPVENPYDGTKNGDCDAFVSKLSPTGDALVYSTYLGGSDYEVGYGIAVDDSENVYVVGYTDSVDFPVENPYDGNLSYCDAFVSKLSPSGNTLVYSTYLGGSDYEVGWGIAVDGSGNAYVTGRTDSGNFPIEKPYDGTYNGGSDNFVSKLSSSGNTLVYSTYLGGSDDESFWASHGDIAVDSSGEAYVVGTTYSYDFPVENPYDGWLDGWDDVFVSKFSPTGETLVYSTYLGGSSQDFGLGIAVDDSGNAYVTGSTYSSDFPVENPCDDSFTGWCDIFVLMLSPSGNTLVYSTYLGGSDYEEGYGIAVDGSGNAYVIGETNSVDFPVENPYDDTYNGNYDGFVSKFVQNGGNQPPGIPDINGPSSGKSGTSYDFIFNAVDPDGNYVKYIILWGDGNLDITAFNPSGTDVIFSHSWRSSGTFIIKAKAEDSNGLIGPEAMFTVTMPRSIIQINTFFIKLLQRFPNAFPIIRHIFGL